ncbi:MAG: tetratricopeptide repeat protein [Fibrobacterota bacterium]|nr:tetratricopeptide repeat protein [Fibrobacterota bacterium]
MKKRPRRRTGLSPTLAAALCMALPSFGESAASDTSSLFLDIKPVLAHSYAGIDTAALLVRIQERQKWGERNDRLIEAEGILHWDRGDAQLALACFKRVPTPGFLAMGLMAEGLLAKGDKYEAAAWYLKSARCAPQKDPFATAMYKRYLDIKPGDVQAELDFAASLEQQLEFPKAAALYWKHKQLIAKNLQATLKVGALLASHGKMADAATLYQRGREIHTGERVLTIRIAQSHEAMENRIEAAKAWMDAWTMDIADSTARNRAIAHLEASGPAGDASLKSLLEKALGLDSASASLHFKMAVVLLREPNPRSAYAHLDRALKASPGNPTYLARLPDAIVGDSLIQANFSILKEKYKQDGSSIKLALLVARGYSLSGDRTKACRAWAQIASTSPEQLEGRRDAFLDLSACGDPQSLTLASAIGERYLAMGFNRDAIRALVQISIRKKDFRRAADHAKRMVIESPVDAPIALAAAKTMMDEGRNDEAKDVLAAIGKHAANAEAGMLLGRMYYSGRDCVRAAEQFQIARDSFPDALKLRGECLAELRNHQDAAADYETHYARTGDKESLRAVARMYKELHYGPKELEVLEALDAKGWAGENEKLRMGMLYKARGETGKAMVVYDGLLGNRNVLPAGEGWSDAAILLGTQLAREGKLDRAIRVLTRGLNAAPAKTPGLAEAWIRLGECHAEKRQWKEAWNAYASALALDGLSGEASGEMLRMAKKLASGKELTEAYRAVYRLDSANEEANAHLAGVRQAAREYKEAAVHYRRLAQYHPSDASAWENLGNSLAMVPDLAAASTPLQTAIDLGAQSGEVYINRARAYRLEGSKDMAASILAFLLSRNPHDYLAVVWSAKFAEEDGKQNLALEFMKKSSKLNAPRSPWPELLSQGVSEAKVSVKAD